jgi:hypothetical protein
MSIVVAGFDIHRSQIAFDALDTETGEISTGRIDATRPRSRSGSSGSRPRGPRRRRGPHRPVRPIAPTPAGFGPCFRRDARRRPGSRPSRSAGCGPAPGFATRSKTRRPPGASASGRRCFTSATRRFPTASRAIGPGSGSPIASRPPPPGADRGRPSDDRAVPHPRLADGCPQARSPRLPHPARAGRGGDRFRPMIAPRPEPHRSKPRRPR